MHGYIDNLRQFVSPDKVVADGKIVQTPSDELLSALGYLELVETDSPGAGYVPYYVEDNGKAVQHWEAAKESDIATWNELDAAYQEGVDSV